MQSGKTITMKGNPLTLMGQEVHVGDQAPDFEVVANDLSPFKLSSLKGKVAVICSVPSLDTPTCDIETRHFNEEAAKLGPDVELLTISMDLPFAQKRWCGAAGVDRLHDAAAQPRLLVTQGEHVRGEDQPNGRVGKA